eukprot:gene726-134_t
MRIVLSLSLPILPAGVFRSDDSNPSFSDFESDLARARADRSQNKEKTCTERSKDDVLLAQHGHIPDRIRAAIKEADTAMHSTETMLDEDLAYAFDRQKNQFDPSQACDEGGNGMVDWRFMFEAPKQAFNRMWRSFWQGSDFRDAADTRFELLEPETVNILKSSEHTCSDGSPYWFGVVPAKNKETGELEKKKIAVEFMGSGSCFNSRTCNLCPSGIDKGVRSRFNEVWERWDTSNFTKQLKYIFMGADHLPRAEDLYHHHEQETFEHILTQRNCFDLLPWIFSSIGWWTDHTPTNFLFNRFFVAPYSDKDTKENPHPLKDYTYVFVLHCTSDSHLGKGSVNYDGHDFHHRGWYNAKFVTDWIKKTFPQAERFYTHGFSAGAIGAQHHVQRLINEYPDAQFRIALESGVFFPEFGSDNTEIDPVTKRSSMERLLTVLGDAWKTDKVHDCVTCHAPDLLWNKTNAKFKNSDRVRWAIVESAFDPTHYWYNRAIRLISDESTVDGDLFFRSKVKFYDQLMDQAKLHPKTFYGYVHHQQGHVVGRGMCSMYIPPSEGQMPYREWWKKFITDELDDTGDAFQLSFFQMDDPSKYATIKQILTGWLPTRLRPDGQMIRMVMDLVSRNQTIDMHQLKMMLFANATKRDTLGLALHQRIEALSHQ